jgi:MFS family permease
MTFPPRPAFVLGASVFGIFAGFGSLVVFSFGVFLKPVSAAFGWSRTQASFAFTLAALTVAAASPFLGRLADRLGPRRVMLPCLAIYAAALAALALVHSLAAYYALYVALGLVGNGTAHLCYARLVSSWFNRSRGAALAAVMAGAAAGAIFIPPLATALIARFGWRPAYLLLAALAIALGLIPAILFLHDPPGQGTAADLPARKSPQQSPRQSPRQSHGYTSLSAARTHVFWLLLSGFFLFSLSVNGCIAHLIPLLTDRSIPAGAAAVAASFLGIFTLAGRLLTGALLDRLPAPPLTAAFFSLAAIGVAILSSAHTPNTAFLAAALTGLGMGAEADVLPYFISRYFGLRSFTEIYGYAFTSYAIAAALGPLLMAWSYDHSRSYLIPTRILAAAMLSAATLLAFLPRNASPLPTEPASLPLAA